MRQALLEFYKPSVQRVVCKEAFSAMSTIPFGYKFSDLEIYRYEKRIPLYGDSVLCTCDRNVVRDAANQFQVSYKSMFYRLRDLKLFEPRELDEFLLKCGDAGGVI